MFDKPRSRSPRWTAASINFLTQDEMHRLLDAIDSKRDYAIFPLAYRHSLRASEAGILHTDDIDTCHLSPNAAYRDHHRP
jgi:integrase